MALVVVVLGALALVPQAHAFVYWSNQGAGTIARANLDGTGIDQGLVTGSGTPYGVTVDGAHLYWADFATPPYIARANLDGTGVNLSFIPTDVGPRDVAVDGGFVYWVNGNGTIGRANLDGTGVDNAFISTGGTARAIAVDASHIWWTNTSAGAIARADLNGSNVKASYIPVPGGPSAMYGVAVDATHVYWSDQGGGVIGRANVDTTGVVQNFISGLKSPQGVEVDGAHIYWANGGTNTIGRANIDGSIPDPGFIAGASGPWGVAVDALPLPSAPPQPIGGGPLPSLLDLVRPVASGLGTHPFAFAAASRGASIAARRVIGTRVSYRLSEPASERFTVQRERPGRRVGRRCVVPTRANRTRTRCRRYVTLRGGFTHAGRHGANSFHFTGRLRGRKLRLGFYRLRAVPTDAAGNRGTARFARFHIIP